MMIQAANKFHLWVKVLVGVVLLVLIVGGMAYDPALYTRVVFLLTLPLAVGFPLLYARAFPWKATILGRALMTHARSVAVLYFVSMFGIWWEFPFKGYVMALVTTYLAIGIGFQFIVMVRIKSRADKAHAESEEAR